MTPKTKTSGNFHQNEQPSTYNSCHNKSQIKGTGFSRKNRKRNWKNVSMKMKAGKPEPAKVATIAATSPISYSNPGDLQSYGTHESRGTRNFRDIPITHANNTHYNKGMTLPGDTIGGEQAVVDVKNKARNLQLNFCQYRLSHHSIDVN